MIYCTANTSRTLRCKVQWHCAGDEERDLFQSTFTIGVSKNRGTPKWMYNMENPIKTDDLGVLVALFVETPIS